MFNSEIWPQEGEYHRNVSKKEEISSSLSQIISLIFEYFMYVVDIHLTIMFLL